ncbi:MAG TPA: Uma2 family endonuclease [Gemmataceae bacterium]|nr:Uma2 family endonuclease [Gemmataceae bacterium]
MSSAPVRKSRNGMVAIRRTRSAACAIVIPEHGIVIPGSAQTLAGFRAWAKSSASPEYGRISFLDGEIFIDMSPEELETHNAVKVEIDYGVVHLNKKRKLGKFYGDRTLLSNEAANLSTEPDSLFILWKTLESGRVQLVPRADREGQYMEVVGTPDWLLEIVSQTSVAKDTKRLRRQYHRAGVSEYWLIDARGEDIDFQILLWTESDYAGAPERKGWQRSRVFGRWFRLTRRRGRMGLWEYTLQVKASRE